VRYTRQRPKSDLDITGAIEVIKDYIRVECSKDKEALENDII
jgi:hypothetical protein